ncbi:MAG: GNAT family N-acetyltransferase [Pseudomonadales bacterium]|nr:GNAT family N-acetyltransferase [Pseudomonadales bacterium]MCP5330743.1 GNAT family N-acetyltransferase [Pseudomonadales bacterium]
MKSASDRLMHACWQLNEEGGEAMTLSRGRFEELMRAGDCVHLPHAFSLSLPAGLPLDYVSYQWAQTRFDNFLFWERVVVAEADRRKGLGRELFNGLLNSAREQGIARVLCAVHERPANRVGHAFVQALGFSAIESQMLPSREIVSFYQRSTAIATP